MANTMSYSGASLPAPAVNSDNSPTFFKGMFDYIFAQHNATDGTVSGATYTPAASNLPLRGGFGELQMEAGIVPMNGTLAGMKFTQAGMGAGPDFFSCFASDGTTLRLHADWAGNLFANGVVATAFTGQLTSALNTPTLSQVPGTKLNTYGSGNTPFGAEFAFGTAAAPLTTAGAGVKISTTWNQAASVYPGSNAIITEGTASLAVYSNNAATGQTQNAAIFASAISDSTHADAVGIFSFGFSSATGTFSGYGAYLQGQRANVAGFAFGAEVRAQNEAAADSYYHPDTGSPGFVQTAGLNISSGSTGGHLNGAGVILTTAGSTFIGGFSVAAGSVSSYAFDDQSSATISHRIGGAHTTGIDTTLATFAGGGAALRMANAQNIRALNAGGTADVNVIGLDSSNRVVLNNSLNSIDASGNFFAVGYVESFDQGGALQFGRWRTQPEALAPAAVTAQTVPDFTVKIAAINGFSPVTGNPIVKAAQTSPSMSGMVPATGGQSVYVLVSIDANFAAVLTAGTAAVTPTRPSLPTNNRGLAYVLIPNGATAITQAMISEFRDLFVPFNSSAAASLPNEPYITATDDHLVLPNSKALDGSFGGGILSLIKPVATDAALSDVLAANDGNYQIAQNLTYSGAVVTLSVPAGTGHTIYFNGRLRTITGNITVSLAGKAAGAYRIYADLGTAGVSTFTLTVIAYGSGVTNSFQTLIGDVYFDGTNCFGDGTTALNGAGFLKVTAAQMQPKMLNAVLTSAFTCTTTAGLLITTAANFPGINFYGSGGTQYWFNGVLIVTINTTGLAATRAFIEATAGTSIAGSTAIGPAWVQDIAAANLYATCVIPVQYAFPANQRNFITFATNTSAATGYQVSSAVLYGTVTGAA